MFTMIEKCAKTALGGCTNIISFFHILWKPVDNTKNDLKRYTENTSVLSDFIMRILPYSTGLRDLGFFSRLAGFSASSKELMFTNSHSWMDSHENQLQLMWLDSFLSIWFIASKLNHLSARNRSSQVWWGHNVWRHKFRNTVYVYIFLWTQNRSKSSIKMKIVSSIKCSTSIIGKEDLVKSFGGWNCLT